MYGSRGAAAGAAGWCRRVEPLQQLQGRCRSYMVEPLRKPCMALQGLYACSHGAGPVRMRIAYARMCVAPSRNDDGHTLLQCPSPPPSAPAHTLPRAMNTHTLPLSLRAQAAHATTAAQPPIRPVRVPRGRQERGHTCTHVPVRNPCVRIHLLEFQRTQPPALRACVATRAGTRTHTHTHACTCLQSLHAHPLACPPAS